MEKKITFLQHTYTSSKSYGEYGTYQQSTGLSPEFTRALERLEHYAPPQQMPINPNVLVDKEKNILLEDVLKQYPVTFLHTVLEGKHIFCRTSYIGKDRHSRSGRMGNFFAHCLIQEGDEPFSIYQLWSKMDWQSKIEGEGSSVEKFRQPLDTITVDMKLLPSAADLETMRSFLIANKNKFYNLVDSILAGKKRILIVDAPSNLLEWAKALTLAFPPHLGQSIYFSSYQHAPILTSFQVVGISTENIYDESEFKEVGFYTLNLAAEPENKYTRYVTEILTQENGAEDYTALMESLQDANLSALNDRVEQQEILKSYRTDKHDFTLETLKKYIETYPKLKEPVEKLLKEDASNKKRVKLYYLWACDDLESNLFSVDVFENYYVTLPVQHQKEDFFKYFFEKIHKLKVEDVRYCKFIELINKSPYRQYLVSKDIEKIQQVFINTFYEKTFVGTKDALYQTIENLAPDSFTKLKEENENYITHNKNKELDETIRKALKALEQFNFEPLKDCLNQNLDNDIFSKRFKMVLEEKINQKTRKELIENGLNFNQYNSNKSKIKQQSNSIKQICGHEFMLKSLRSLSLLNAIVQIRLEETITAQQIKSLNTYEKDNLVMFFKNEKSIYVKLLNLLLEIELDLVNQTATDPYLIINNFLTRYKENGQLILEKYKAYHYNSDYHYFRYIQLSIRYNYTKLDNDKSVAESYLDRLGKYREKEISSNNRDSIAEIDKVIKYLCDVHGLPIKDYIIPTKYERDAQLFGSNDVSETIIHAKNLYLGRSYTYDVLLNMLYNQKFFKKYWTYERWIMFIKELELDGEKLRAKNNYIKLTVDFFLNKIENCQNETVRYEIMRLFVEFTIAILIEFDQFTTEVLITAFEVNKKHNKNLKLIFPKTGLEYMDYFLNDQANFKEFKAWVNKI